MRTYDKTLGGKPFKFRLTIGKQREMNQRFGSDQGAIQVILSSVDDLDMMSYLLGAAADWPGNENPTVDGDQIYDLLVDSGASGMVDFLDVALGIAEASGIVDASFRVEVSKFGKRSWENIIKNYTGEPADPIPSSRQMTPELAEID